MDKSSVHKLDAHELKKYLVPVIHEKLEADIEIHQFKYEFQVFLSQCF